MESVLKTISAICYYKSYNASKTCGKEFSSASDTVRVKLTIVVVFWLTIIHDTCYLRIA